MDAIEQTKKDLAEEEEKLFFFDNFDKMEMEKEEKHRAWVRTFPSRSWNLVRRKKVPMPEGKIPRWEKREQKRGPPK